jgi:integrase
MPFSKVYLLFKKFADVDNADQTNAQRDYYFKGTILNYFDDLDINDIFTVTSIEKWYSNIASKPIASTTKNYIVQIMQSFLKFAFERKFLERDIYDNITPLINKFKSKGPKQKNKFKPLTREQFKQYIATFDNTDNIQYLVCVAVIMAYEGGFRVGELLGLKPCDINHTSKTITVQRQIQTALGTVSNILKTSASYGDVMLPDYVYNILNDFIIKFDIKNDNFIFDIEYNKLTKIYTKHLVMAELPFSNFHYLRHAMVTNVIMENINSASAFVIAQKRARHASLKETLDTYAYLIPDNENAVINRPEAVITIGKSF